jgi:glutamate/tyrosine decarboxylase-like PLP-dependent enzyme
MADPVTEKDQVFDALAMILEAAEEYLGSLPDRLVYDAAQESQLERLQERVPEDGVGTVGAVEQLAKLASATATASAGPRFYHFVIGGSTPAALAADWLVSVLDQNAAMRASSVFAHEIEAGTIRWLRDLLDLPETWGGVLTASATLANFTGLGAATHWWAEQLGVDYSESGISGLGRMSVLSSGYVHASARKALQMLGHGRDCVETFSRDSAGRVDLEGLESRLADIAGPAVIVATVGEVNAGDSDPVGELADLAERHGAWLHVDGAFGVFARLSPATSQVAAGIERADSLAADAHKWLNVPYESGFALLAEPQRLGKAFGYPGAPYLPDPDDPRSGFMFLGPESSRRARALPIWSTLAAYGRSGYRELVERHCELARYLANRVDDAPDLERLAEVPLNIVCFRFNPSGLGEERLDEINREIGESLLDDGRVFAGLTTYQGQVALRPAISNWMTTKEDIDYFADVVRELGARAAAD